AGCFRVLAHVWLGMDGALASRGGCRTGLVFERVDQLVMDHLLGVRGRVADRPGRATVLGRGHPLRFRAGCSRVLAHVAGELLSPRRPARGSSTVGLTRSGACAAAPRPNPGLWESSHRGEGG